MNSKQAPLWLCLEHAETCGMSDNRLLVIFKVGDDLRQDSLTLQLLRVMNNIWMQQDMDLKMKPYGCVSTYVCCAVWRGEWRFCVAIA